LYADFYIASKKTYSYDEYNRFYEEVFNKMERDIIHKAIRSINELEMVVKNELNDWRMDKQKFFSRRKSLSIIKSKLDSMFRDVLVDEMNNMDKTSNKSVHSLFFPQVAEIWEQQEHIQAVEISELQQSIINALKPDKDDTKWIFGGFLGWTATWFRHRWLQNAE